MEKIPEIQTEVSEIGRYGAAVFCVTGAQFVSAGFWPGDLVEVTVGKNLFTVPAGTSYTDVNDGEPVLLKIEFEDRMLLAANNENGFAPRFGIIPGDPVLIRMKEKQGYRKEYELRSLWMGEHREEYPSDETFCNFRAAKGGKLRENYLYRGFSPINPTENRADLADRLLSQTSVKTVINLDGEGKEERAAYAGYGDRYYASLNIIPVEMKFSVQDPSFGESIRQIVEALLEEEGSFYIHCRYGRDRTGLVFMILEALCEAAWEEMELDYMLSYENIHGLKRFEAKWNCQVKNRVNRCFENLTGVCPDKERNGAENRLLMEQGIGKLCRIPVETLRRLEEKLSQK